MDIAIKAMLAGFVFGFLACALVFRLQYKRNLREARKLRDAMRSTRYPGIAGWWELHQKLEAEETKPRKPGLSSTTTCNGEAMTRRRTGGLSPALAYPYGQEQQHANENPRGTAQRSDTDAST